MFLGLTLEGNLFLSCFVQQYHVAVGKVWGEIVRDIADSVIVPFSMTDMAEHMNVSWHQVRQDILAENTSETPYDFSAEIDFGD